MKNAIYIIKDSEWNFMNSFNSMKELREFKKVEANNDFWNFENSTNWIMR